MYAVEKQLRAAIKFLDGVKSLPGYAQLEEKQVPAYCWLCRS